MHRARLLADTDPDVRIFAVNMLGDLRHPKVPAWLQQVTAARDARSMWWPRPSRCLAEVGDAGAPAALRAARQRFADDAFIAFAVDLTVERIEAS